MLLGWFKSNCRFSLLNSAIWYLNSFLNKCGYVIHHFNVHFSLYFFLLMTYYLLFIFILDCRNGVRKQIWVIFLFIMKLQRQFATSTTYLAQQLLMNIQCSAGSRSFAKETRALKMRSAVVANGSWQRPVETIVEADPLTTTQEVAEELGCRLFYSFTTWSKLEKWKSSMSGCLVSRLKIKKIVLKCLLLLYTRTMNHFSIKTVK